MRSERICIGLSCCLFHEDKSRPVYNGRPLLYVVESMPRYLMSRGALVFIVPPIKEWNISYRELFSKLDALVIHGGADVSPLSYGEEALREDWEGDRVRDVYELDLIKAALDLERPILGVCRGAQLINVAFGGTLYQDINTQLDNKLVHRNAEIYEKNRHRVSFQPGSIFNEIYPGQSEATINSVHHQAIKDLGKGLRIEALSEDGIVESVILEKGPFCWGVQWHPEFQGPEELDLLDPLRILEHFMSVVKNKKSHP